MTALETLRPVALAGIAAPHTRRAYGLAMEQFVSWYAERRADLGPVTKAVVGAYSEWLQSRGLAAATVAQRLSAVRRLFLEASDAGAFDAQTAQAIGRVRGPKRLGRRLGKWLSLDEARVVVGAPLVGVERVPPFERLKRYRDRAVLAVLVGCGLRRAECAGLRWAQLQQRDQRWCLVDVVGKGGRIRTVPVPSWVVVALEEWKNVRYYPARDMCAVWGGDRSDVGGHERGSEARVDAAAGEALALRGGGTGDAGGGETDAIFASLNRSRLNSTAISADGVDDLVRHWSAVAGTPIAAHDLRRTHAKLARRGGVDLEQLQYALGHASVKTTQTYVGENQSLEKGPGDFIAL